jgi:zinc D-Ala-D-Ala dipeptidase
LSEIDRFKPENLKQYKLVPIAECGEPLVSIPADVFDLVNPHPYAAIGAPYGTRSPFYVRQGILDRLQIAQHELQGRKPGWRIQVFDAYRPVEVQQYMVDYTFDRLVRSRGLSSETLSEEQRQEIWATVFQFWAIPNDNPETPPPHSTGAAIDITLVDATNCPVNMGSAIDEISPRSFPHYFASSTDETERQYCANRQLLADVMLHAEFRQHPNEWWHFSYGDQLWVWLAKQASASFAEQARYGVVK